MIVTIVINYYHYLELSKLFSYYFSYYTNSNDAHQAHHKEKEKSSYKCSLEPIIMKPASSAPSHSPTLPLILLHQLPHALQPSQPPRLSLPRALRKHHSLPRRPSAHILHVWIRPAF